MPHLRYPSSIHLLALATFLATSLGASPAAVRAETMPQSMAFAGFTLLSGKVLLPASHPRNLDHYRMRDNTHTMGHHLMPQSKRVFAYRVMQPGELKLDRIMNVRAVPIPPPRHDSTNYTVNTEAGPIQADVASFDGTIDAEGNFKIHVPPYKYGYYVAIDADKVRLKTRIPFEIKANGELKGIILSVRTTLLANVAAQMGEKARGVGNGQLETRLGEQLDRSEAELKARLVGRLNGADWQNEARKLMNAAGLAQAPGRVPGTTANGSGARVASTYTTADTPVYNMMSSSELPAGYSTLSFGSYSGATLTTQYEATNSIRFATYMALYRTPSGGGMFPGLGIRWPAAITESSASGASGAFVTVDPKTAGGGVDIIFTTDTVKSIGMNIQNGDTHNDHVKFVSSGGGGGFPPRPTPLRATTTFPRRNFKFKAYDSGGSPIYDYRWYTKQTTAGGGFYGLTADTPIYRLRIEVTSGDPFTIDELLYSTSYASSLQTQLGWRSTGSWALTTGAAAGLFTSHTTQRGSTPQSYGADANSGGSYWNAPYGGTAASPAESTLTAPGFTLSNMDLDVDDISSQNYWLVGANLTAVGSDTNQLAQCRIPSGGCSTAPWKDWHTGGYYAATMETHWSHVHWQAKAIVEDAAKYVNTTTTSRYVEYSTDNGATWRNAYWIEDEYHHGNNTEWWYNHLHPFEDSDMTAEVSGIDFNRNGVVDTDFTKDGTADYTAPNDNNGDGVTDANDAREWDTEFYQDYVDASLWTQGDRVGDTSQNWYDSSILGTTISYRFRWVTGGLPATCATCTGWYIDDVNFNNDNDDVGYYTDFASSIDPNQ